MKLRTKKSHFQNLPEGTPPTKFLPQLLRFFYYLLLLAILGAVCVILVKRYLYFTGTGQVEVSKVKISSEHGGTLQILHKGTGDSFAKGDVLARIRQEPGCIESPPLPEVEDIVEQVRRPDPRLIRLRYSILQKEAEKQLLQQRLSAVEGEIEKDQDTAILYRALEIGDVISKRKNQEMIRNSRKLRDQINLLAVDIRLKKEELAMLELAEAELALLKRQAPPPVTQELPFECVYEDIVADFSGKVDHVTRKASEYLRKGEPLFVVIPENNAVVIEAYINRKNLRFLKEGEIMSVEFPDRTTSSGRIKEFVSSGRYHTERIKEDYIPVKTELLVTLIPTVESDKHIWQLFDRMDVRVKGERK